MAPKIVIAGAGLAGCMLARLLLYEIQPDQLNKENPTPDHARLIDITMFEAEPSVNFRSQGGSLDLHTDTGILALQKAGLFKEFEAHARHEGEAFFWGDKNLNPYIKMSGGTERPEIDREDLRNILMQSLPEGIVQWGKKLVHVKKNNNTEGDGTRDWELEFADGTKASGFDLIIGADGAWSKVRSSVLSDQKPFFSGVAGYVFVIPDAKNKAPDTYALVNKGSCFCIDGGDTPGSGRSIMSQQMTSGDIKISAYTCYPEEWQTQTEHDIHDGEAIKKFVTEKQFSDWHPRLLDQIRNADGNSVVTQSLYMLPVGFKWAHKKGFTLLGDAAHLMTPFAGEGVNLAFEDAIHLSNAIKQTIITLKRKGMEGLSVDEILDKNLIAFEKNMNRRATKTQALTLGNMTDLFFTPHAPAGVVEKFVLREMKFFFTGSWRILYYVMYPALVTAIYTGYFVYKRFILK